MRQPRGDLGENGPGQGRTAPRCGLRETQEVAEGSKARVATEEAGDLAGQGLGGHYKGCG